MKKLLAFALSLAMVLSLAACGGADANVRLPSTSDASSTGSDAEYNISIASTGLPTQAPYMATTDFVSAVETAGNGRFKFVVHDSSSLGTDEDILKQVIDGTWKPENYYGGMKEGLVDISPLADFCRSAQLAAPPSACTRPCWKSSPCPSC